MRYLRWVLVAAAVSAPGLVRAQSVEAGAPVVNVRSVKPYAGSEACADCHAKEVAQFAATGMGKVMMARPRNDHEKLGCESCHGPGQQHANSGGEEKGLLVTYGHKNGSSVEVRNNMCLRCHEKTARTLWKGSTHESRNVACTDCHAVMHEGSERGNLRKETVVATCGNCHASQKNAALRTSHMPLGERKMECTSCHNPHGSANPKLLLASSVNETCYSCHTEKRGPMLWEHPPVVENCANCHDPHGSSHEKMLKVSRPRLCQQCHAGATRHPTGPKNPNIVTDVQYVYNRQCSNCHSMVHGSNHPSGKALIR